MKTPDEIKKGLECCVEGKCSECPYERVCDVYLAADEGLIPADAPLADWFALVNQLERERDAAVEAVYPMLLKQAEVSAASYRAILWILGISALVLIISAIGAALACNSYNKESIMIICIALIFVSGVVALVAGIIAGAELQGYFTATRNPDMWVVEYVARLLQ